MRGCRDAEAPGQPATPQTASDRVCPVPETSPLDRRRPLEPGEAPAVRVCTCAHVCAYMHRTLPGLTPSVSGQPRRPWTAAPREGLADRLTALAEPREQSASAVHV